MNTRLTNMAVEFGTFGILATSKGLLCVRICTFSQKNAETVTYILL